MEPTRRASNHADDERAREILNLLAQLAEPLASALGSGAEVVVHDLHRPAHSVIAVGGNVTGRRPGAPLTDLLLSCVHDEAFQDLIHYRTWTDDGRPLRSSTIFVKGADGRPLASICLNFDIGAWYAIHEEAKRQLTIATNPNQDADDNDTASRRESFPVTVQDLVASVVDSVISTAGVPVELMRREHRAVITRELDERGIFLIHDAIDYVAAALGVSKYTIYGYLRDAGSSKQHGRRATTKTLTWEGGRYAA